MGNVFSPKIEWPKLPEPEWSPGALESHVQHRTLVGVIEFDLDASGEISPREKSLEHTFKSQWGGVGTGYFVTQIVLASCYNPSGVDLNIEFSLVDSQEKPITKVVGTLASTFPFSHPQISLYTNHLQDDLFYFMCRDDVLAPPVISVQEQRLIKTTEIFYYVLMKKYPEFIRSDSFNAEDLKHHFVSNYINGNPQAPTAVQIHQKGLANFVKWLDRQIYAPNCFLSHTKSSIKLVPASQKIYRDTLNQRLNTHSFTKYGEEGLVQSLTISCQVELDVLFFPPVTNSQLQKQFSQIFKVSRE